MISYASFSNFRIQETKTGITSTQVAFLGMRTDASILNIKGDSYHK